MGDTCRASGGVAVGRGSGLVSEIRIVLVAAAAVLSGVFLVPDQARAAANDFCSVDPTPPCVQSLKIDGVNVPSNDPDWDAFVVQINGGMTEVIWSVVNKSTGLADLGAGTLGKPIEISLDLGDLVPRVSLVRGESSEIERSLDMDDTWNYSASGQPTFYDGGCETATWPWVCPSVPNLSMAAIYQGWITDYETWEDQSQLGAMFGLDLASNIESLSLPPEINFVGQYQTPQLILRLANSHFRGDGTTVFEGFLKLRIPSMFLEEVYGIDDPSSFSTDAVETELTSTSGSPSGSISIAADAEGLLVTGSGLTFSARTLKVTTTGARPTKPGKVRPKRQDAKRAKVKFAKSKSRGSKVRRYEVSCKGVGHKKTVKTKKSPVKLKGLKAGKKYKCQVRAFSKAGPSAWSAKKKLKAK